MIVDVVGCGCVEGWGGSGGCGLYTQGSILSLCFSLFFGGGERGRQATMATL